MIEAVALTKTYLLKGQKRDALKNVSLQIKKGESVGLVGESGSGKSTLGKLLLRLIPPTSGQILFDQVNISELNRRALKPWRKKMQMVFQDPYSTLNPRMTIEEMLQEPLELHGFPSSPRQLLAEVGLSESHLKRFPHEFSGGQRQRIAIARALAVQPEFLICDEPLSALDMATQHHVMQLLKELKEKLNMTLLFISHDLLAVKEIANRMVILKEGQIVEEGLTEDIFNCPKHPYTQKLVEA